MRLYLNSITEILTVAIGIIGITSSLLGCSQHTPSAVEEEPVADSIYSTDSVVLICTEGDTVTIDSVDLSTCTKSDRRIIEQIQIVEDMNHKYDEMKEILDSMVTNRDGGYTEK